MTIYEKKIKLHSKVTALLIKRGNNKEDVLKMVREHFDYAMTKYANERFSNASKIAEVIRSIY